MTKSRVSISGNVHFPAYVFFQFRPPAIALVIVVTILSGLSSHPVSAQEQIEEDTKNVKWAGIPYFNYNNTIGFTFGALGRAFYSANRADTISPSSSTGIFGMYTTNKTYFAFAFQQLYLDEDNWRMKFAAGLGNLNFQYWQTLPVSEGVFIGFGTNSTFAMAQVERRIYDKLYGGINAFYINAKTEFDLPEWVPDSLVQEEVNLNNVGYVLNYDKRENQFNPRGGFNIEFKHGFYRDWLNSDYNFQKFEFTYNHFFRIRNNNNILVTRVNAKISTGNVPFQGQNVVGQDDIRGYSSGKYRNNQVYAIQTEYRWRFYKKWGMVGFVGMASAVDTMADIPDEDLLPGVGLGLRYMMIEKERINIGIDIATGKDDWGLYFRIGESFMR